MAQIKYRGNLSARVFPFISEFFGRSVIVGQIDQDASKQFANSEDLSETREIPQVYYCHNVMPSSEGLQSIGYGTALSSRGEGFISIYLLRDTVTGIDTYFSHRIDGKNFRLNIGETDWTETTLIPNSAGKPITVARVGGQSYIYFYKVGCYVYNIATNTLDPITLTGLDESTIIGIISAAGYLIAWTETAVYWSSAVEHVNPTDPFDFVPSLVTGAGGGKVEAAAGNITYCIPHYLGFIAYTTDNAVASVYSGNARFPFNFREIVSSGGVLKQEYVASDAVSGNHYAYTTSGLQLISISATQTVFPAVTDFIAGKYFEDFLEDTLQFVTQTLNRPMQKALKMIADRYLVISYGATELTHAIVFDVVQKRFGKLKITHTTCFEYKSVDSDSVETPRFSIGFLQYNGSMKVVDFSYTSSNSSGVLLLGKFQYVRARLLQLDSVELENIRTTNNFKLYNYASLNGKSLPAPVEGYLQESSTSYRKYLFKGVGINHSLLLKGNFFMTSFELTFHNHGKR